MKLFFGRLLLTCFLFCSAGWGVTKANEDRLADADAVVIAGAYDVWKQLGEEIWSGWTKIDMPLIYITETHEFAIGYSAKPRGFSTESTHRLIQGNIYCRKRTFQKNLAASFPATGVPAVVIGTPQALEQSATHWTLTCVHEMFHVLQMTKGSFAKSAALEIGPQDDADWQLNFPFPYDNENVMRLLHLDGYPLYLGLTQTEKEAEFKYMVGTSLDARKVLRDYLNQSSGDSRAYKYSLFQEWKEGIARYTEYRMAELSAKKSYEPSEEFQQLNNYKTYVEVWKTRYQNQLFLIKHAGRAAKSRNVFYQLGLGKGLVLDRLMPGWKSQYFEPGIWLDDLLTKAIAPENEEPAVPKKPAATDKRHPSGDDG